MWKKGRTKSPNYALPEMQLNSQTPSPQSPIPINILVLVSGNGTNLQALLDAEKKGSFGKIKLVVSDRREAYALERAKNAGVTALAIELDKNTSREERRQMLSDSILQLAITHKIDLIVLAGFLWVLKGKIIEAYSGRMINLHPALLPKFGGIYGEHVHRAVLEAGETESGCTIHLVDSGTDTGPILLQRRVLVLKDDTPESLAEKIHKEEHIAIVEAVIMMVKRLS